MFSGASTFCSLTNLAECYLLGLYRGKDHSATRWGVIVRGLHRVVAMGVCARPSAAEIRHLAAAEAIRAGVSRAAFLSALRANVVKTTALQND